MKQNFLLFLGLLCVSTTFGQFTQYGQSLHGTSTKEYLGSSISLNQTGNIMAVGAHGDANSDNKTGYVVVLENNGSNWVQIGDTIKGDSIQDYTGYSVDLNDQGNILAVGSPSFSNQNNIPYTKVYQYDGSNWVQLGNRLDGITYHGFFGNSVALNSAGDILAVAAKRESSSSVFDAGCVKVFEYDGTTWNQLGSQLEGDLPDENSGEVISLNADGFTIAIGSPHVDNNRGRVKVYSYVNSDWVQLGNTLDGSLLHSRFGLDIDINNNGNRIAVGAPTFNNGEETPYGSVTVYDYDGTTWNQVGDELIGEYDHGYFGQSVRLSNDGEFLLVGILDHYNMLAQWTSGGVNLYRLLNNNWVQQGETIEGEHFGDKEGHRVDINGDGTIYASSALLTGGGVQILERSGRVKVFTHEALGLPTELEGIRFYPNPTSGFLTISKTSEIEIKQVKVYNTIGQIMNPKIQYLDEGQVNIDLSKLKNGIYITSILFQNGELQNVKIVLNK